MILTILDIYEAVGISPVWLCKSSGKLLVSMGHLLS